LIEDAKIRGQVWNLPLPSKIGLGAGSKPALVYNEFFKVPKGEVTAGLRFYAKNTL
jgi:hypothetical protein